ncbi:FAD-binding oxidoreductase [Sorangium atrum]|uniref:FAD-linked oxidase C-terminal domain-containing protein n=1 Tax=Sorangium atrum TaxID=2995308 RepID=A0ABT5C4U0_9BACT|nr:FAD-linked oxidase C-terminal domain-containing protein [Sorangium aterium]MDC0680845.1 FAD-linked oxidase C-terminal domain-containing protein [Sorangium aterium]
MNPLDELALILGDGLVTDRDIMEGYRRDQALWAPGGWPIAVARPASTAQVQALAQWATRHRTALVPRGAGTGVAGGATATDGCVVVSFERMNRILAIDEAAMLAVVQPGVLNGELKAAAHERGLWYPPDPSSYAVSTLGGNVATNAGGLCCVKYGVTSDYVLGLEAVLADGTVLRTGGRSRKDVAGYDLTRLLVGSEGTLALITEITLRLRRRPPRATTLVATFTSLEASGRAVAAIVRSVDASMLEIMDRTAIRAVERFRPLGLDTEAAAMLIAQSDAPGSAELSCMQAACEAAGGTVIATTEDESEGQMMLTARRLALTAVEQLGTVLVDDVAVPLPQLPEMLRRVDAIAAATQTTIATVAHAGDGNLHPLVVFDGKDAAAEARAVAAFNEVMAQALGLGGTITGEHGVGTLKRGLLTRQLGAASLALHRRIKHAFDPGGILNPGKVIDS